jgi:hypothetical protein
LIAVSSLSNSGGNRSKFSDGDGSDDLYGWEEVAVE